MKRLLLTTVLKKSVNLLSWSSRHFFCHPSCVTGQYQAVQAKSVTSHWMVNVWQKLFLFRVLINKLVVLIYLKVFHFHLLLFFAHSGIILTPSFPRTCCSLSPCADAYLLFRQLHVPLAKALFVYGLELLWLTLLQALFPYETEKKGRAAGWFQCGTSEYLWVFSSECKCTIWCGFWRTRQAPEIMAIL